MQSVKPELVEAMENYKVLEDTWVRLRIISKYLLGGVYLLSHTVSTASTLRS